MAYQVIARKYRPQRFSEVVGQDHVTRTLTHAIEQRRIAHAYLFCGPRGTGKTTIARIFAKCLNCVDGPRVDFPDDDPRCREIAEGRSLDVIEIDGASNRGIDEIRQLRETVRYVPAVSRFKVFIIDEVHMLTKEAFNALLKTLEEPPEHVKFMFATTEPEKVLPTILSRCQRYDLRRIPVSLIVQHLELIAKQEGVRIESAAAFAIARGSEGCMRDAESTLDQLISFCGSEIQEADVLSMFGMVSQRQIQSLAEAILTGKFEVALRLLDELVRGGKELPRLISEMLAHFRDLLVFQVSRGDTSLLEVPESQLAVLREQATLIGVEGTSRVLDVFSDCEYRIREAASKKTLTEVALYRAIQARHALDIEEVLAQLRVLKQNSGGSIPALPTPPTPNPSPKATSPKPPRPAPAPEVQPTPPVANDSARASAVAPVPAPLPPGDTDLGRLWVELVNAIGRASAFTRSYFAEAHPVSLAKNVLTIGFDPEFADHLSLVDTPKVHGLLQTKLSELGRSGVQVKFIQAERPPAQTIPVAAPPEAAEPTPAAEPEAAPVRSPRPAKAAEESPAKPKTEKLDPEAFKNDPLIKEALEVFKGQIVEVRR